MKITYKYIIVPSGAILFNESTTHKMVAEGFIKAEQKVLSAGFCSVEVTLNTTMVKCFGESSSLNMVAKPAYDEQIIRDLFSPVSKIKYFAFNVVEFYETGK